MITLFIIYDIHGCNHVLDAFKKLQPDPADD